MPVALMALSYACMDKDGMDRIQSSFSLKDLDDLPEDCEVGSLPWDNEEASSVARRLVRRAHFFPMSCFSLMVAVSHSIPICCYLGLVFCR